MFSNIGNNRRTHESPMDWEWQSHNGPTDPNSPFPQFRPHRGHNSNFESPKPASSSFINASSTPAPQFRNPSFTTPRKPFDPDLFSEASGAESSPADNADAEDTPDAPKASTVMTTFTSGSERKPLFGRYGADFLGNSPGRAEQRRGKFANAIQKVRKRKRVERDYSVARSHKGEFDSDSDSGPSRPSSKGKDESKPSWISNFLNGIESRPTLPHVLAYYLQLGSNLFLLSLFVFFVYTFWTAIRSDVDKATDEAKAGVMAEMAKCARDYADNFCGRNLQAPAMSSVCGAWELCMNQDPNNVGRAQVGAHTFAQIFNSFIEPISYKSMLFIVVIALVAIGGNNMAFGAIRSSGKHSSMPTAQPYFPPPPQGGFQWGAPPQTPQHNIGYDQYGGQTFQAIMPSQTPGRRSPSKGSRSPSKGNRSPSKGNLF